MNTSNWEELEQIIGYHFADKQLLKQAMLHSSCANERKIQKIGNYERLEFLGDAILEFVTSEFLYQEYPDKTEGELTKLRASLVCEFSLSSIANELELGRFVQLSKGEEGTGGRHRESILCDLFESLLGAIFLDGGIEPARDYVMKYLLNDVEKHSLFYDTKTTLQEVVHAQGHESLEYELLETSGPEHHRTYRSQILIGGKPLAQGSGTSKKASEQRAAYEALLLLKKKQK